MQLNQVIYSSVSAFKSKRGFMYYRSRWFIYNLSAADAFIAKTGPILLN